MPSPRGSRPIVECWCCGRSASHQGRGLCATCYTRWQQKGFAGPGPGPEFQPQTERARDHAAVITALPARAAAERIGVSARTIVRWRAALRETT